MFTRLFILFCLFSSIANIAQEQQAQKQKKLHNPYQYTLMGGCTGALLAFPILDSLPESAINKMDYVIKKMDRVIDRGTLCLRCLLKANGRMAIMFFPPVVAGYRVGAWTDKKYNTPNNQSSVS